MLNRLKKDKQGFTLIEIVLVLAIAGLIMVIVFLAVSGAQRSRRDTQRKNDLSRIAAQIESFASNNGGCYPESNTFTGCTGTPSWATFYGSNYITSANLNDPLNGSGYNFTAVPPIVGSTTATTPSPTVNTANAAQVTYAINGRQYQVCIGLEQGNACRDNK